MKVKFNVSTDKVGSKISEVIEIEDDLSNLTAEEKEAIIEEYFNEWIWNNIDTWWEEIEEE